jgi:hypothetical protein
VIPGMGVPDWYTDLGARYGANSTMFAQWKMCFSKTFVETVFEMGGGGYPGEKLAVFSSIQNTSDYGKLVVSTLNQWKFPYLYQYSQSGATANLYANLSMDYDVQPVLGQGATCRYNVYKVTPPGTIPVGCKGIVANKWITFDLRVITGGLIPGTTTWAARRTLWMTIDGVKTLVIDYDETLPGAIGRNSRDFEAVWLAPYMTSKSATQDHPVASVWYRDLIVDDKEIVKTVEAPPVEPPPVVIIPGTLPSYVPPPGTFAEFTLNTFNEVPTSTGYQGNDKRRMFANWCGGVIIPEAGEFGTQAVHGGGEHSAATDSCGVALLDIAKREYSISNLPTKAYKQAFGKPTDGDPTSIWGEHADGTPGAAHTYNQICRWPAAWGPPKGGMARIGGGAGASTALTQPPYNLVYPASANAFHCAHLFDISKSHLGTTRLLPQSGSIRYGLSVDWGGDYVGSTLALQRGGWFSKCGQNAASNLVFITKEGQEQTTPLKIATAYPFLHYFEDQDVLLIQFLFDIANQMLLLDLSKPYPTASNSTAPNPKKVVPSFPQDDVIWRYAPYLGFRWSTIMKCFVGLDIMKSTPTLVYLRPSNPANVLASTWAYEWETLASFDGSSLIPNDSINNYASSNGVWGRLEEVPALRSFVWTPAAHRKGMLLRPQAMA